ncbi:MAG: polymer-forming cytoskeletal protein [Acidobacteriota bacterium]|nr:polymer-forming cytoskeletal protein [Acidobacteriota bacterium]
MDKLVIPKGCEITGEVTGLSYSGDIEVNESLDVRNLSSSGGSITVRTEDADMTADAVEAKESVDISANQFKGARISGESVVLTTATLELSGPLSAENDITLVIQGDVHVAEAFCGEGMAVKAGNLHAEGLRAGSLNLTVSGSAVIKEIEARNVVITGNIQCERLVASEGVEVNGGNIKVRRLEAPKFIASADVTGIVMVSTADEVRAEGVRGFLHPSELDMFSGGDTPAPAPVSAPSAPVEPAASDDLDDTDPGEPEPVVENDYLTQDMSDLPDAVQAEEPTVPPEPEPPVPDEETAEAAPEELQPVTAEDPGSFEELPSADLEKLPAAEFEEIKTVPAEELPTDDLDDIEELPAAEFEEIEPAPAEELPADDLDDIEELPVTAMDEVEEITDSSDLEELPAVDLSDIEEISSGDLDEMEEITDSGDLEELPAVDLSDIEEIPSGDLDEVEEFEEIEELPVEDLGDIEELPADSFDEAEELPVADLDDMPTDEFDALTEPESDTPSEAVTVAPESEEPLESLTGTEFSAEDIETTAPDFGVGGLVSTETPDAAVQAVPSDAIQVNTDDFTNMEDMGHLPHADEPEELDDEEIHDTSDLETLTGDDILETSADVEEEAIHEDLGEEPEDSLGDVEILEEEEEDPEEVLVRNLNGILDQIRAFFPEENYPQSIDQIRNYVANRQLNLFRRARNRDSVIKNFQKFQHEQINSLIEQFFSVLDAHHEAHGQF